MSLSPIFTFFLAPPGSSHISDEPPRGNLAAGDLLHRSLSRDLAFSSSSDEVLEVISSIPLATMEPEIVSSCHAVDAEEDSLLQKSGGLPSHHDMVDQHPEDSTLEAEDAMEDEDNQGKGGRRGYRQQL
jgi:hypothetical protein